MGLDTVELVMGFEDAFRISISDAAAEKMFTTRNVVDHIYAMVRSAEPEDNGSLSMRAFFRLRNAFQEQGVPRELIRPEAKISTLLGGRGRRDKLSQIMQSADLGNLSKLPFGLQFTFGNIRSLTIDAVIQKHSVLRLKNHGWSKQQVREVVRAVMFAQLALKRFSDDAEIVKDLGVD